MKKQIFSLLGVLFLLGCVLSSPLSAQSQASQDYKQWNISTNPFSYFFGSFPVSAAYAFTKHVAVRVSPSFRYFYFTDPSIWGLGGQVGVPVYFDRAYRGFFLEPGASISYIKQNSGGGVSSSSGVLGGPELLAGYSWLWDSGFNIDAGLGLGYYWASFDLEGDNTGVVDGILPTGRLGFGYSF